MDDMLKQRPRFDWTINLGHLLTVLTFICMAVSAWVGLRSEISGLAYRIHAAETGITKMAETIEKLTTVVINVARQEERLGSAERRIDMVERRVERVEQKTTHSGTRQ